MQLPYPVRSTTAGAVRAAARPGSRATRLAITTAMRTPVTALGRPPAPAERGTEPQQ
ncbi:MAG TPA: hypothetical protein VMZ51_05700 [Acidimicrobiales bacterium]|nr:hypothetical protein [Acidimicrobiales bacterium]